MRLTSVSVVLEPGNNWERKITIIIERCGRSTSWGQISLFVIKEQIKDLFSLSASSLLDHIVTGYQLLSSQRGSRFPLPFFDSLVFGCRAVGVSKRLVRAIYNATLASLSWEALDFLGDGGFILHLSKVLKGELVSGVDSRNGIC